MSYCEDCICKNISSFKCDRVIGEHIEVQLLDINGEPAIVQKRIYGECKTSLAEYEENVRLIEAMK